MPCQFIMSKWQKVQYLFINNIILINHQNIVKFYNKMHIFVIIKCQLNKIFVNKQQDMNNLFAERLKSARMMNGLSLQDLADRLQGRITRQAIHKYEKGEVLPDSEMMGYLSEALGVRPDFFVRETFVELGEVKFRKIVKLPVKEQNSIIERTREMLERYLELEEIVGVQTKFSNPITLKSIVSLDDVEKAAIDVRNVWKLGNEPISNVIELFEDNCIKVLQIEANDEFDGMQAWVNNQTIPVIVLNINNLKSGDRKRFTALHELGHLLLPLKDVPEKMSEKYCHAFAGMMLLPKDAALREIGIKRNKLSIQELGIVKQNYGISIQAIIYRLFNLEIISEYYMKYFFQYINQMGWKIEEPYAYTGQESSNRFDQLIFRALSEEIISISKAASLKNLKVSEFKTRLMTVE